MTKTARFLSFGWGLLSPFFKNAAHRLGKSVLILLPLRLYDPHLFPQGGGCSRVEFFRNPVHAECGIFLNFNAIFVFSGCVLRHFRISGRVVPKPSKWASIIFRAFTSSLSRTASDRWFPDCAFLSSRPMIFAIRSTKSSPPNFQPRRISFQSASSACSPLQHTFARDISRVVGVPFLHRK